ncbi:hypothetical protein Tco_0070304 [Tanacetum coccineum]
MHRAQESGARDEDYINTTLLDYEAKTGVPFKLRHCWEVLKGSLKWMQSEVPNFLAKSCEGGGKRYKPSESSSFNIQSGEASIKLDVGDNEEDEVQKIRRHGQSERLMVSEIAMHNERAIEMQKEKRKAFLEIKRREVECREQELANQEYRQCQEDIRCRIRSNHDTKLLDIAPRIQPTVPSPPAT